MNSAPNAVSDLRTGPNTAIMALNLLTNDSDPNNDPIRITHVNGAVPILGTPIMLSRGRLEFVSANGNVQFHYFPNAGAIGIDTFTYTITDGLDSSTANVTLNIVSGVNNRRSRTPILLGKPFLSS